MFLTAFAEEYSPGLLVLEAVVCCSCQTDQVQEVKQHL